MAPWAIFFCVYNSWLNEYNLWRRIYRQMESSMDLGTFSISLAVKDINASKVFYEKLGFKVFMGDIAQN
jgi:catechol-2,3-dioxygenase